MPSLATLAASAAASSLLVRWVLSLSEGDGDGDGDCGGSSAFTAAIVWCTAPIVLSTIFGNPFWKTLCVLGAHAATQLPVLSSAVPMYVQAALAFLISRAPHLLRGKDQPAQGVVFVTGCDSGMGYHSAVRLARAGYHVVAGCYLEDSSEKLKSEMAGDADDVKARLTPVNLNVTSDESVKAAAEVVKKHPQYESLGLVGAINCAGVGYNGPAMYFPLSMYREQMEVNYFGYVRVAQAFLPLLIESSEKTGSRRGRLVFFGTGGGPCSPCPPLLSAYMSSKFAVEAFCSCTRLEMQLTKKRVDLCMVNPGFIKPTNLMAGGLKMMERMWAECEKINGDGRARQEYGDLLDQFVRYSENEKGTHVSVVAETVERLMADPRPLTSYKVGDDSKAAPFVGMLPAGVREFIVKKSMFGETGAV